jgi:putative membrane protein
MPVDPRDQVPNVVVFLFALAHALWTWDLRATLALFLCGMAVAFALETLGVGLGLLRHNFEPQVAGVPVTVVLAWPGVVYVAYRLALVVTPAGVPAAALAAVVATLWDAVTDPGMVERGAWTYPESPVSDPRFRGVPWWNFVAWLAVVFVTALAPTLATGQTGL